MAELLATLVMVVVLAGVLMGLRAVVVTQRRDESFALTPRRLASSLAIASLLIAYTRWMIMKESFRPSAEQVAASNLAVLAFVAMLGWWLWTLYAEGVISLSQKGPKPPLETTHIGGFEGTESVSLEPDEEVILRHLKEAPRVTVEEISLVVSETPSTVYSRLEALRQKGQASVDGRARWSPASRS